MPRSVEEGRAAVMAAGDAVRSLKAAKVPSHDERLQSALVLLKAAKEEYEKDVGEPYDPPKPPPKPKGPSCAEVKAMKRQQPPKPPKKGLKPTTPSDDDKLKATAANNHDASGDSNSSATSPDAADQDKWLMLDQCVGFLNTLTAEDVASPRARSLRLALRPHLATLASREVVGAEARQEYALKREIRRATAGQAAQRRAKDQKYSDAVSLRAERLARLAELQTDLEVSKGKAFPLVCDGPAIGLGPPPASSHHHLLLAAEAAEGGKDNNSNKGDSNTGNSEAAKDGVHSDGNKINTFGAQTPKEGESIERESEGISTNNAAAKACNATTPTKADGEHSSAAAAAAAPSTAAAAIPATTPAAPNPELFTARQCYTCKQRFTVLHHFYHLLCPTCAAHNWAKRHQTTDLSGKVVLLTGGRVKIGYEVGLKLLRAGATLVVTSRFPRDTAQRYAQPHDAASWQGRLHVVGLDLRDSPAVEHFAQFLHATFGHHHHPASPQYDDHNSTNDGSSTSSNSNSNSSSSGSSGSESERGATWPCCGNLGLFAVIHNACQTVRRPPAYYRHLLAAELAPYGITSAGNASSASGTGSNTTTTKALPCLRADAACWSEYRGVGTNSNQGHNTKGAVEGGGFEIIEGSGDVNSSQPPPSITPPTSLSSPPRSVESVEAQRKEEGEGQQEQQQQVHVPKHVPSALRAAVPLLAEDWAYGAGGGAEDWNDALPSNLGDSSGTRGGGNSSNDHSSNRQVAEASASGESDNSLVAEASALREAHFPGGALDHNGSQIDLRPKNSWRLPLEDVSTPEASEVMAVNALAPFVLNSRLVPLMRLRKSSSSSACNSHPSTKPITMGVTASSTPVRESSGNAGDSGGSRNASESSGSCKSSRQSRPCPRFIVNVSAMEGKFYRHKTPHHPHTNMAKAALNMMTRTCAGPLAKDDAVFMTSVDTGWVNDENPLEMAAATAAASHFQTPIDEVDAAARICDPIFSGLREWHDAGTVPAAGVFLKDYHETEW